MAGTHAPRETMPMERISRKELTELLKEEAPNNTDQAIGFALIHVGRSEEYLDEHIPGSINVPPDEEQQIDKLFTRTKEIILYSGSGTETSALEKAGTLEAMGFTTIWVYEGGISDWEQAGEELERGRGQEAILEIQIARSGS